MGEIILPDYQPQHQPDRVSELVGLYFVCLAKSVALYSDCLSGLSELSELGKQPVNRPLPCE